MKKRTLAAIALALPLSIGSAWATTTTLPTHDYGSNSKNINPYGSGFTILLSPSHVTVTDFSAGSFSDSFSLSGLGFNTISEITLTLTYKGVQGYYLGLGEEWSAILGGVNLGPLTANGNEGWKTVDFKMPGNANTFASLLSQGSISLGFSEGTWDLLPIDSFKLKNATLSVVGAVPEPESYAMLLAGLALMGTIARRRNKNG